MEKQDILHYMNGSEQVVRDESQFKKENSLK